MQHMVSEGNEKPRRAAHSVFFEVGLESQVVAGVYQAAAACN